MFALGTLACNAAQFVSQRKEPIASAPSNDSDTTANSSNDQDQSNQFGGVFFAIHIETSDHATHSNSVADEWNMLEELVATADEYGHKLTLEFQPQWAEYALENPDKLAQIRTWEANGHEIAGHHHGVSHAAWDGYTNVSGYQDQAKYRGTMDDAMAFLNQLPASGRILTAGLTDEDSDWPEGVIYATGGQGQSGGGLLSVPKSINYQGESVAQAINQGYGLQIGPTASLEEIEGALHQATSDQVLGIVTHPYDFAKNPELFIALFDLLSEFDIQIRTVSDILDNGTTSKPIGQDGQIAFDPANLGKTFENITYCTANGEALLMDIYYPEEIDGPWPVTVYVHGGGWVSGDKSKGAGYRMVEPLRKQGYLVVSINYRLSPEYQFPAHIEDVKCGIRHLRANASFYNLDPERIGAFGGSAGGHLVALLGTSDVSSGLEGSEEYQEYSSRVQAVVDLFGPTDDDAFCIPQKIETVFGAEACEDEIISIASPMTYISADDPPFLIFHGDQDDVVPISQSERLHEALTAGGVPSTFITVENAGHGFSRAGDGEFNPSMRNILQMVLDFFDEHLKTNTSETSLPQSEKPITPEEDTPVPPVYLTVALHIEDTPVYANCQAYPDFREKLLQFAEAVASYEAAINLQIDYEFFVGVSRCETAAMQADTQGQNVLDFLAESYGYEIDAHQEGGWDKEGQDNYADIRYLGGQVTTAISENAGGLVWDDSEQWQTLTQGERGLLYPDFIWTPEVLTLAVSSQHHLGDFTDDDIASGVWIPEGSGDDFWTHDPNGPMVYVGPGEYDNWGAKRGKRTTYEFILDVLAQLEVGSLERHAMYTATIAVPQSIIFHPEEHAKLQGLLDELSPLVDAGKIEYVTYSQALEIWQEKYQAKPNIYINP